MKVLMVNSELVAAALQDLVKPGVEVVCIDQDVDSKEVQQAILLSSPISSAPLLSAATAKLKGHMAKDGQIIIILV